MEHDRAPRSTSAMLAAYIRMQISLLAASVDALDFDSATAVEEKLWLSLGALARSVGDAARTLARVLDLLTSVRAPVRSGGNGDGG